MGQIEPNCADQPDEIDHKIAIALVQELKVTDSMLANQLGVSRRTISRRRNSEAVKKLVREALSIPVDEIRRLTLKGLRKMEEHLDSPEARISLAAAVHLTKLGEKMIETESDGENELIFEFK